MAKEETLSDDFVASLLAKDAKTSNAKYSIYGLQELMPKRSTYSAPKPNTRFLKNIIKETDSHNAALRAKEAAESRARLNKLRRENARTPSPEDGFGRLSRESDHDNHRSKRRRTDLPLYSRKHGPTSNSEDKHARPSRETDQDSQRSKRRRTTEKDHVGREVERRRSDREKGDESRSRHTKHKYHDSCDSSEEERHDRSRPGHRRHHRKRDRSRSRSRSEERSHAKRKHRKSSIPPRLTRSRSKSPDQGRRHRPRSPHESTSKLSSRSGKSEQHAESRESRRKLKTADDIAQYENNRVHSPASDSDPLEAIIGPVPPPSPPKVRARGRGAISSNSAMDSHFSSNYDPSFDVQPEVDVEDDWDMALEALRDRQKWQKQGAERLKAAGFTEEEVEKWEKGGEKREEDVRWRGRGEGREWDRGKVVSDEGVETKPEWGRLKGT